MIITTFISSNRMDESPDAIHRNEDCFSNEQPILRWHSSMFVTFLPYLYVLYIDFPNTGQNPDYIVRDFRLTVLRAHYNYTLFFTESQYRIHYCCIPGRTNSSTLPDYSQIVSASPLKVRLLTHQVLQHRSRIHD